jgi:hypothetical protein
MDSINIKNWENFQHYKDRRPKWIKLLIEIIDEFDADGMPKKFFSLPDSAKLTFVLLACLRANYNKHIPYPSDKWLKNRLGVQTVNLQPLIKAGFITIDTELIQDCPKSLPPETERETEGETEGKKEKKKYMDFVLLTKEEYKKLVDQFGEAGASERISNLNTYIGSKGKKYKSHYFTILSWERKNERKTIPTGQQQFSQTTGSTGQDGDRSEEFVR